jgi:hypothetical protein
LISGDSGVYIVNNNVYDVKYNNTFGFLDDLFTSSEKDKNFDLIPISLFYDAKYGSTILNLNIKEITQTSRKEIYKALTNIHGINSHTIDALKDVATKVN